MSKVILVTGGNAAYHDRLQACVDSLKANANVPYCVFSVGYQHPGYVEIPRAENVGAPDSTECIQHGSFLRHLYGADDAVIVYIDGDVHMQRPFDAGELEWLANFPERHVSATWNRVGETLIEEARALGPRRSEAEMVATWGKRIQIAPALNAGVIVARRSTWGQVYNSYLELWGDVTAEFSHQARQQWLICWTYAYLGMSVDIMPWTFHAHGHFGLKPGMETRSDGVYADGKLAALRHYL
jgi:hypothetical protein